MMVDDLETFNQIKSVIQSQIMQHDDEYLKITTAVQKKERRIILSVNFLNQIAPDFTARLINDPFVYLPPLEQAINDIARQHGDLQNTTSTIDLKIGLSGWLGSHSITPRGISCQLANKLILVEGIVTRVTIPNLRLKTGSYYVSDLGRHVFREYADSFAIVPRYEAMSKAGRIAPYAMRTDPDGRETELEFGLSQFKDCQFVTLQEMPEVTPIGQLPRAVEIVMENDLVEALKPGDRARVYGVLKSNTYKNGSLINGATSITLIAVSVEPLHVDYVNRELTPSTLKQFRELARRENTLDLVAASIAPSISGHERVRKGLALQLVGGVGKQLESMRQRGDIHVLLIGDPSCGKSQMLRYVMKLAPLAISTTGRGSSAVGLTAAVVKDPMTGHKRLEAGAMVLADSGMVCIDEFDKMGPDDRVAVHEVMEQQRVSVMKANISAVLNARTSVLAAANPLYGHFDDTLDFADQVNFPDSLLSRFDLIFLIRESSSAKQDRQIAKQVLAQLRAGHKDESVYDAAHRLRALRADVVAPTLLQPKTAEQRGKKQIVWQHAPALEDGVGRGKGKLSAEAVRAASAAKLIKPSFLKQYLAYCRYSVQPEMSEEAEEDIAEFYGYIRERVKKEWNDANATRANHAKALPTPRLLEALIRLSTAHAKLKLKAVVDTDDVAEAKHLVLYSLCGYEPETVEATATPTHTAEEPRTTRRTVTRKRDLDQLSETIQELQIEENREENTRSRRRRRELDTHENHAPENSPVDLDRELDQIWRVLETLRETTGEEDWDLEHAFKHVAKEHPAIKKNVYKDCLKALQSQNRVM
ncbi:MCM2/3/5 family protein [Gregarina niphandrodes]|uniref:MCM2/3/5 family protein n=1 Tax=Gregarina niphandrodes TaxID=110365 RepID=A0A023B2Y8_GRENI|nr:MCM2/3/5 family protein [Gregarina niphandrodes]EZG55204.1 MCM2/3/5 family protein [Gregarina niphandrodes]|eukprot:XP_011131731.1 MCM2/3/5 family protein [Gregarina niphandrodes]